MNHQWTPADDLAAAQEEQAKLRAFDAAYGLSDLDDYEDDDLNAHWQTDDRTLTGKGFVAGFGLSLPIWALIVWWLV